MKRPAVFLLAALSGYCALSQEIVWVHALSFAGGDLPQVFAHVLGMFLVGIAAGSLFVEWRTQRPGFDGQVMLPLVFASLGALSYLALPVLGRAYAFLGNDGIFVGYGLVAVLAFAGGCTFPLLCHLGIRGEEQVGGALSWIYFANILGSAGAPLITTFVLMDRLPLPDLVRLISIGTVASGLIAVAVGRARTGARLALSAAGALFIALTFLVHAQLYEHLFERLLYKDVYSPRHRLRASFETRSGTVSLGDDSPPTIWGGGVYDGRLNLDPVGNSNGIRRAYMIASLHPRPGKMLELGLSGGAWARVLVEHPEIRSLDIVEINPAYLELIRRDSEWPELLEHPKVSLHVDDGRRWLNRNPDERFDFILMNNSVHWRSQATNLLSREFLETCRRHLAPGGVLYFNATNSSAVAYTAAQVFEHVVHYESFIAGSDAPFQMSEAERRSSLEKFTIGGHPVFGEEDPARARVLEDLATTPLPDEGEGLRRQGNGQVSVTDDNMATEFRANAQPALKRGALERLWKKLKGP